ncbi:YdcH family protein [Parvularcula maris]
MKIAELEEEHRDLDQAIISMEERMPYDRLTIGRMKKRKLVLKDQIEELRDRLFPDIIA